MTVKRYLSYDDMAGMLNAMYRQMAIHNYKPDIIVGISRGGLVPAVHFSHYFDVPLVPFKYSLRDHQSTDPIDKLVELMRDNKRILIVDDICDEGHTLHEIHENLKIAIDTTRNKYLADAHSQGYDVDVNYLTMDAFTTAVLQHNLGATLFEPDYCGEEINKKENPEWICYPYEY